MRLGDGISGAVGEERCGSAFSLLVALSGTAHGLVGAPTGVGIWDTDTSGVKEVRKARFVGPPDIWAVLRGGCSWCSVAELGTRLEDWV